MPIMTTKNATRESPKAGDAPGTEPALVEQMATVRAILQRTPVDLKQLSNECLLLSKIIDILVANNRKPNNRHDILPLVHQVCKYKDKPDARVALLLLLLSVKSAFRTEWFSMLEISGNDEIFSTLNWLFDCFTTGDDTGTPAQSSLQPLQCGGSAVKDAQESLIYLSTITTRCVFPRLQMNAVFVAVLAQVGYEVLVCDFHVPHMNIQDRVYLYVGRKDSVETATSLITPPQVNFLVNGQEVERRVTSYVDGGPQMPSDVTRFVRVGANVLQVVGEFSESYIIALASSRAFERTAKNTQLEDYVAPTKAASCEVDPNEVDDEVVEGASRLSLRCPISHQRLVTPVKATACRHLQCFDYDSFLEINEKRPAWRCPCCNRFMSWPDLRIDRHMEKILKEADENIHEVIIYQDGSWVPVSTGENQSNSGPNVTPLEEGEIENAVIELSGIGDEELNGVKMNIDEFQLPETKPDVQTLQAIKENRGSPPQTTNPVVQQRDTVEQPGVLNVPNDQQHAQTEQQWQGPGIPEPHQLATNPAQFQNLQPSQQFQDSPVISSPNASALQQNWRPTVRMRGSIGPFMDLPGVLGPTPPGHSFIEGNPFIDPVHVMQYQTGMPPPDNLQTMPPFPRGPHG